MTPEERKEAERKKAAHKAAKLGKAVELEPKELKEAFETIETIVKPRRNRKK
jgi:hypothetical protein